MTVSVQKRSVLCTGNLYNVGGLSGLGGLGGLGGLSGLGGLGGLTLTLRVVSHINQQWHQNHRTDTVPNKPATKRKQFT